MSLNGNTLELVAMDVNFSMKKVLEVNGNEDGVILVPAQSLGDLLAKFSTDILTLTQKEGTQELTLTSETGTYHIPLIGSDDYPSFPEFEGERILTLPEDLLGQLIRQTVYACSTDESRPLFTGVFMEKKGSTSLVSEPIHIVWPSSRLIQKRLTTASIPCSFRPASLRKLPIT